MTRQHTGGGLSVLIMFCVYVFFVMQTGSRENDSTETAAETDGPQQGRGDTFQIT